MAKRVLIESYVKLSRQKRVREWNLHPTEDQACQLYQNYSGNVHYTTFHYTTLQLHLTTLHYTRLYYTTLEVDTRVEPSRYLAAQDCPRWARYLTRARLTQAIRPASNEFEQNPGVVG